MLFNLKGLTVSVSIIKSSEGALPMKVQLKKKPLGSNCVEDIIKRILEVTLAGEKCLEYLATHNSRASYLKGRQQCQCT